MPRAIWTGAISFGLVNVPVRMYSAIGEHKLHFRYVHEPDGSPIGYEKVCKAEDRPVPGGEIVKAFELEPGEWVYMRDEDFEAARPEDAGKTIQIADFVPREGIDPVFFERSYYLGPEAGAERVYALFVRALEQTGLAGIARFVMRDREYLGALRVEDGVVVLERMYFADEVRPRDEIAPAAERVGDRELGMAVELIERLSGPFEPEKYEDTYRERLCEIIRAKRKGERVPVAEVEEPEEPEDLLAALRRSVEEARRERPSSRGNGGDGGLERLSKEDLLERARELDVRGRSRMSKDQLIRAVHDR